MKWFLRSLAAASSFAVLAAPTCLAPTAGDVKASRWRFPSGDASRRTASTADADREIGRVADQVGGGVEASPSIDDWRSAIELHLTLERVLGDEGPEAARLQAMWGSKRLYWEEADGRFFLDEIEIEPRGGSGWAPFDVGRAIKSAIGHAIVGVLEEALADEADDPTWTEIDHRRFSATVDGEVVAIVDLPTPKRVEAELQDLASAALAWRGVDGAPQIAIDCGSLDPSALRLSFESHRPFSNLREGRFLGRLGVFGAPSLSSRSWKAEERRMPFMVALSESLDCPFPPYRAIELTLLSSVPSEAELLTAVPAWLIDAHPELDERERLRRGRGSWARAVVEGGEAILSVVNGGQLFEAHGLVPIAWLPQRQGRSILLARQATATLLLGQYLLVEATSEGLRVEPLTGIDARVFEFNGIRRDEEARPLLDFIDERPPLSDRETRWIRIPLADVHRILP